MKRVLMSAIMLMFIAACAQDFAPLRQQQENKEMEKEITVAYKSIEEAKEQENKLQSEQSIPQVKKQPEQECLSVWKDAMGKKNDVHLFEGGKIIITFTQETTFDEALNLLQKYNVEKQEILAIFKTPDMNEEEKYAVEKKIKGKTKEGEEIAIACRMLQESGIQNAHPEVTFGFVAQ